MAWVALGDGDCKRGESGVAVTKDRRTCTLNLAIALLERRALMQTKDFFGDVGSVTGSEQLRRFGYLAPSTANLHGILFTSCSWCWKIVEGHIDKATNHGKLPCLNMKFFGPGLERIAPTTQLRWV